MKILNMKGAVPGIAFRRRRVSILSIFFIIVMSGLNLYADAQAEQFYRANELFQEQKYKDARMEYEALNTKGPVAWYNIGVCYSYEENNLESLVAFKRALKGADSTLLTEIFKGIDKAQGHNHPQKDLLMRKLYYYASYFSLFLLQISFLFLWFLLFLCWFFKKKTSRSLRIFLWLCVVWAASSTAAVWWLQTRNYVIIMKESNMYAGPNEEYHTVGKLEGGDQLILLDSKNSWYKVKNPSTVGWIKEEIAKHV